MMKWTDEQYDAIMHDNTSIIVSAGAGSGKTAVLSERVIRKIDDGVNINNLLILTFTNKAAMEMKERIRKKLKKDPKYKKQLDLIDEAYITTFDSFALSIVKKYHQILNIPKDISIIDSSIIYLEKKKILDDVFESFYRSKNPSFIKLINDFCTKDDNELKDYILNIYEKSNLLVDKNKFFNEYSNFYSEKYINDKIREFEEMICSRFEFITNILDEISNIDYEYSDKLKSSLIKLLESNNYDEIVSNINFRLPNLPKDSDDDLKTLKESLAEEIKQIKSLLIYNSCEEIKKSYLMTHDYAFIIIDILNEFDKHLMSYKNSYYLYEFNDITKMLINLLENNIEIRNELKDSYNEIMIDEYQDTSDLQEYFTSLISSNNVYMVGDIKQSIYRFRNANPNIFKTKYYNYSNNDGGYKIDLNKNFRSRSEVLNNINLCFENLMTSNYGGADYNNGHAMVYGNHSYDDLAFSQNYNMEILNYDVEKGFEYSNDEIEIFTMANDILNKIKNKYQIVDKDTNKLRDCKFSDFVILIDRSSNFDLIKKIFEFKHIPLTIFRDEKLNNEVEIVLLKNILRFILKIKIKEFDKEFRYLFVSIARSFLFEYSDNKILEIINDNSIYDTDVYKKAYEISKNIDYSTNNMITNKIIDSFNFYDNIIKLGNVSNRIVRLDYILDLSMSLDKMGYTTDAFSLYLSDLDKNKYSISFKTFDSSKDSVSLMSIHASKGLEFSICYFPFLSKEFNLSDLKEKFLFSNQYGIICPYYDEGIGVVFNKLLLKEQYLNDEISERIRLFYVALTRAKEKMIFITNLKYKNIVQKKFRCFLDILEFNKDVLKPYILDVNLDNLELSHEYNFSHNITDINFKSVDKLSVSEIEINNIVQKSSRYSKSSNDLISKDVQKKLDFGTMMHYYLEVVDFNSVEKYKIDDFYKNKIVHMLENPIFKNISCGKVYKEFEFIDKDVDKHGIIDLMIIYDDYVDIIDYKLKNIDDDAYYEQLNGYKEYISKVTGKNVNTYLYSIFDEEIKKV